MIIFKLIDKMKENGMKPKELIEKTGLTRQTVKSLLSEYHARIDLDTLEHVCNALDCEPGDLLKRIPD